MSAGLLVFCNLNTVTTAICDIRYTAICDIRTSNCKVDAQSNVANGDAEQVPLYVTLLRSCLSGCDPFSYQVQGGQTVAVVMNNGGDCCQQLCLWSPG